MRKLKGAIAVILLSIGVVAGAQSVSCTSVTRGKTMTCTAAGGVHYKNWLFSDGSYEVSRGATIDLPTWTGVSVQTGHVSVDVYAANGGSTTVFANVAPLPRGMAQFSLQPVAAIKQTPGYVCDDGVDAPISLTLPSPPTAGLGDNVLGKFCELSNFGYGWAQVTDDGPNKGYFFINTVTSATQFDWVESNDLVDTTSTFYKAQCGGYNKDTNALGFISGAQLGINTVHHESGSATSHYANWLSALADPTKNPGVLLESSVYLASTSQLFARYVTQRIANSMTQIANSSSSAPCPNGVDAVNYDQACVYDGKVNYMSSGGVYASCQ